MKKYCYHEVWFGDNELDLRKHRIDSFLMKEDAEIMGKELKKSGCLIVKIREIVINNEYYL